jgi:hypothetical protein
MEHVTAVTGLTVPLRCLPSVAIVVRGRVATLFPLKAVPCLGLYLTPLNGVLFIYLSLCKL